MTLPIVLFLLGAGVVLIVSLPLTIILVELYDKLRGGKK